MREGRVRGFLPRRVAGANTSGNDRYEALEMAEDAQSAVLAGHMKLRRSIPVPSAMVDGQEVVAVNPIAAAKLELHSAMRDQGMTKRALAERLGLSDTTVGRLADPDHRSHVSQVTRALLSVGIS